MGDTRRRAAAILGNVAHLVGLIGGFGIVASAVAKVEPWTVLVRRGLSDDRLIHSAPDGRRGLAPDGLNEPSCAHR